MKRSKKVGLLSMAPVAAVMLAGCGEKSVDAMVFYSEQDCNDYAVHTRQQCRADYARAQALHPQSAPRYQSATECEAEFGAKNCEPASAAPGMRAPLFMPLMAGYLTNAGSAAARQASTRNNRHSIRPQPLYTLSSQPGFRTAGNVVVSKTTGFTRVRPSQVEPQPARLYTRGGFGQQARARTSFGG